MTGVAINQMAILGALGPGVCLTVDQLDRQLPEIGRKAVVKSAGAMIASGLLCRVETGCYRLTAKGLRCKRDGTVITSGPNGPDTALVRKARPTTLRQKLWNAIRARKKFSIDELLRLACNGSERDAHNNACKFVSALERVGYLRSLKRAPGAALTSNGFQRWQLLKEMDTGIDAPVIRQSGEVFDRNRNQIIKPVEQAHG